MYQFIQTHWQETVGTLLGFLYLYYELKASNRMFPTGILMSAFYVGVFFNAKFYAFASIQIYFIFAQLYAWSKWRRNTKQESAPLRHVKPAGWIPLAAAITAIFGILWWILTRAPQEVSAEAWGDSIIATLNIVAIGMLAQRYVEQWLLLVAANALSVYLFYVQQMYPTTLLYFVYFAASVAGYVKWSKMARNKPTTK